MASGELGGGSRADLSGDWHDDLDGNRVERVHALTALTPSPWRHILFLRLAFAKTKLFPGGEVSGLQELAFVHFARWSFVRPPKDARKHRGDRYLLFESNFNGSFAEYLDAFATQLKKYMGDVWGGCYDGPTMESTTEFRDWARRHEVGAEYYYCPYPKATVNAIAAALSSQDGVDRLVGRADGGRSKGAGFREPGELVVGVSRLLAGLQSARQPRGGRVGLLGALLALPHTLVERLATLLRPDRGGGHFFPWWPPWSRKGVSAVTVLAPIAPEGLEDIRSAISRLKEAGHPIGLCGRTHFARWVVIDRLLHDGISPEPIELEQPLLLFSAAVDGAPDEYLRTLYRDSEAHRRIWNHCEGMAEQLRHGHERAARFLDRYRVRGGLFYPGYTASVGEVKRALATRRELRAFAVSSQGAPAVPLGPAFLARFGGGVGRSADASPEGTR